jgi:hypothetical protein
LLRNVKPVRLNRQKHQSDANQCEVCYDYFCQEKGLLKTAFAK